MPRIPRRKYTNFTNEVNNSFNKTLDSDLLKRMKTTQPNTLIVDEIKIEKPNVERQNNIIIGIAVGVMVVACGIIYVAINVNS